LSCDQFNQSGLAYGKSSNIQSIGERKQIDFVNRAPKPSQSTAAPSRRLTTWEKASWLVLQHLRPRPQPTTSSKAPNYEHPPD